MYRLGHVIFSYSMYFYFYEQWTIYLEIMRIAFVLLRLWKGNPEQSSIDNAELIREKSLNFGYKFKEILSRAQLIILSSSEENLELRIQVQVREILSRAH